MNPLQVPQEGLYGERYLFTGHFCLSLETLIKIPLNKIFSPPFLRDPKKRAPLHVPQNRGPMEADTHFQSLNISFGVPGKGALPPGSFHESL